MSCFENIENLNCFRHPKPYAKTTFPGSSWLQKPEIQAKGGLSKILELPFRRIWVLMY
jgi:hypothetical protein